MMDVGPWTSQKWASEIYRRQVSHGLPASSQTGRRVLPQRRSRRGAAYPPERGGASRGAGRTVKSMVARLSALYGIMMVGLARWWVDVGGSADRRAPLPAQRGVVRDGNALGMLWCAAGRRREW